MTSKARTMVSVSNLLSDMVQPYHEEFMNVRAALNWLTGLDDPIPRSSSSERYAVSFLSSQIPDLLR